MLAGTEVIWFLCKSKSTKFAKSPMVAGKEVSWLYAKPKSVKPVSSPISSGTEPVITLPNDSPSSRPRRRSLSAAPAARIQVVTASIVLCGRYRQLSSANDERVAVIMLWGREGNFFLIQELWNLYLTRSSARALASSVAVVFGSCTRFLLRP